jgi:RecB family exonuclease
MTGAQLGLDFDAPRLVRVTPARLGIWQDCRRRYRLTYLDRPAPVRMGARAASTLGAVVHLALRTLFALPPEQRTPQAAARLVDRHWTSEGFRDAEQAHVYRERARGWVAEYALDCAEGGAPEVEAVGLEQWVSVAVGRIVAEGRVDRIDRRGDELVIVDYKTGRRTPTEEDAHRSQALAIYAVAAAKALRKPCRTVELHHLPSGTIAAAEHTDASLAEHLRRAERTAAELRLAADTLEEGGDAGELFPTQTGSHCSWCDFRPSCPEGQQAAPPALPWDLLAP